MSEWLPIETAPQDGSMFLVWVNAVRHGEDDEGRPFEQDCSTVDFGEWRTVDGEGYPFYFGYPHGDQEYPTHWMPLPERPPKPEPIDAEQRDTRTIDMFAEAQ